MDDDMATYNDTREQPRTIRASIPSHSDPPRSFFVPSFPPSETRGC